MKRFIMYSLSIILVILAINFNGITVVQAASKDMVGGKRDMFQDDSVESMRDVFARRETEDKNYKKKMLANSDKSIKLLMEIRVLLQQLNEKE